MWSKFRRRVLLWKLLGITSLCLVAAQDSQNPCTCTNEGATQSDSRSQYFPVTIMENRLPGLVETLEYAGDNIKLVRTADKATFLEFFETNRTFYLKAELDAESRRIQQNQITIRCTSINFPDQISFLFVTIGIGDYNDNSPQFNQAEYHVNVSENTKPGIIIVSNIEASDLDSSNSFLDYSIVEGNYSDYFEVERFSGKVTLLKMLDYEKIQTMNVTISVEDNPSDNTQPKLKGTTTLVIHVLDVDDTSPVFPKRMYQIYVEPNAKLFSFVSTNDTMIAVDADSLEDPLVYSLEAYDGSSYFEIDKQTGSMRVIRTPLPPDSALFYELKATQMYNTERFGSALVRIEVGRGNVSSSFFFFGAPFEFSLMEGTRLGTHVFSVPAFQFQNADIYYTVQTVNFSSFPFHVDPLSGAFEVSKPIDYEDPQQRKYHFVVTAFDSAFNRSIQTSATVNILNANDNEPEFTGNYKMFNFSVLRDEHRVRNRGSEIVLATDPDGFWGQNITYRTFVDEGLFDVNDDGMLLLTQGPSAYTAQQYVFGVSADDNQEPSYAATALITVTFDKPMLEDLRVKGQVDMSNFLMYIFAVLSGVLLVIVIGLAFYIFRNAERHEQKSKSSERDLDTHRKWLSGPSSFLPSGTISVYDSTAMQRDALLTRNKRGEVSPIDESSSTSSSRSRDHMNGFANGGYAGNQTYNNGATLPIGSQGQRRYRKKSEICVIERGVY